jgi:nitrile hydratase
MNGVADMGGMHGFGPVDLSDNRGPFHDEWEKRILGLTFATLGAGLYNVDEIRRVTEGIPPARYLYMTYFERWIYTAEILLAEKQVFTSEELAAGRPADGTQKQSPAITPQTAEQILTIGGTSRVTQGAAARFRPGDRVVARNINPSHHTRLTRYVRGKPGVIERDHGIFALPDTNSCGLGANSQHVYGVRFKARDLWGPDASARDTLQIDLFEDYLEPAP